MEPLHPMLRPACLIGLLLVVIAGSAQSATIVATARSTLLRAVYYDPLLGDYTQTTTEVDPVGYGDWSSSQSGGSFYRNSVSQSSFIGALLLSASGTVTMQTTYQLAKSSYHVVFTVPEPTQYQYSVDNVDDAPFAGYFPPDGFVRLDRVDPGNPSVVLEPIQSTSLGRVDPYGTGFPDAAAEGVLEPGTYAVDYLLEYAGFHTGGYPATAGFALVLVPEPQTLLLVGSGLVVLGLRRSRKHARREWEQRFARRAG
jgi:hypothetical protein